MKKLMSVLLMAAAADGLASFSYQGALKMADGSAVEDRNKLIEFRLYDGPGEDAALLWAGQQSVVISPTNGLFNVEIGDTMPALDASASRAPLDDLLAAHETLYIGLTVERSSGEIRPRQRILPVPTASFAYNVKKAQSDFSVASNLVVQGRANLGIAEFSGNVSVDGRLTVNESEVVPVPVGGIILWAKSTPPEGDSVAWENSHWAICDGRRVGTVQTPNLTARFVVGADPDSAQGDYLLNTPGGAEKVTLTVNEMPSHNHKLQLSNGGEIVMRDSSTDDDDSELKVYARDGGAKAVVITSAGNGQAHENRPPYFALFYIMRVR